MSELVTQPVPNPSSTSTLFAPEAMNKGVGLDVDANLPARLTAWEQSQAQLARKDSGLIDIMGSAYPKESVVVVGLFSGIAFALVAFLVVQFFKKINSRKSGATSYRTFVIAQEERDRELERMLVQLKQAAATSESPAFRKLAGDFTKLG